MTTCPVRKNFYEITKTISEIKFKIKGLKHGQWIIISTDDENEPGSCQVNVKKDPRLKYMTLSELILDIWFNGSQPLTDFFKKHGYYPYYPPRSQKLP